MHFSNESRKRKTNFSWPLTLIMQRRDHFRLLRHHYSEIPVIPLSNDIWYRCVAHGFITFYFLIFYRWSINWMWSIGILKRQKWNVVLFDQKPVIWVYAYQSTSVNGDPYFNHFSISKCGIFWTSASQWKCNFYHCKMQMVMIVW
jgi:hypothetical protein